MGKIKADEKMIYYLSLPQYNIHFRLPLNKTTFKIIHLVRGKIPDVLRNLGYESAWNSAIKKKLTFKEICSFSNVEQRRVLFELTNWEPLFQCKSIKLVDEATVKKRTFWINKNGELETISYYDKYCLYKVPSKVLMNSVNLSNAQKMRMDIYTSSNPYEYFVKMKDTSTNRNYVIFVSKEVGQKEDAIEAIASTIEVPFKEGQLKGLYRQGDCILCVPKSKAKVVSYRKLTKEEYLSLMCAES